MKRENSEFRENHPMLILGIPDVVVVEAIDIGLELAVGIDIGVGDEESCPLHSQALLTDCSKGCIAFRT